MADFDFNDSVRDAFIEQIEQAIDDNGNDPVDIDTVYEDFRDAITGNDNGSYSCNTAQAAENVKTFMFSDDWDEFIDYLNEMGQLTAETLKDPETLEVLIRDYVLSQNYMDWGESYDQDAYIENMTA